MRPLYLIFWKNWTVAFGNRQLLERENKNSGIGNLQKIGCKCWGINYPSLLKRRRKRRKEDYIIKEPAGSPADRCIINDDEIPWNIPRLGPRLPDGEILLTWLPSNPIDRCVIVLRLGVTDANVGDKHRELLEPLKLTIETLLGTCRPRTRTVRTILEVSTLPSVMMLLGIMLELSSVPTMCMLLSWRYTFDLIIKCLLNLMLVLLNVLRQFRQCSVVELIPLFGRMLIMVMCP